MRIICIFEEAHDCVDADDSGTCENIAQDREKLTSMFVFAISI